jgi:hypothetical protein
MKRGVPMGTFIVLLQNTIQGDDDDLSFNLELSEKGAVMAQSV